MYKPKILRIVFSIALLAHLVSYGLPFISYESGYMLFVEGVEAMVQFHISVREYPLVYGFYFPLLSLPVLGYQFYKQKYSKSFFRNRLLYAFLQPIPFFVTIYFVISRPGTRFDGYGYWIWGASILLMYILYILQSVQIEKQSRNLQNEDDWSVHLVDEED